MSRLGPDSKFMQGLGAFTDAVVVNLLFLLCSLPVVTVGAALSAAHGTLLEAAREEGSEPARTFFRYFARTWRGATVVWLALTGLTAFLLWEYSVIGALDGGVVGLAAQALVVTGLLCLLGWGVWAFPLLAQGHGLRRSATLAARLAIGKLPVTLLALVVSASPVVAAVAAPAAIGMLAFGMVVVGFAFVIYLTDLLLAPHLPTATA